MTKVFTVQTNFTAGELSPRLYGHVDFEKYKNGIKTGLNALCIPHGPIDRRPGFEFIKEVKTSAKATRLLRFQFDQYNAYILEFGENYIRFYIDGGVVLSGGTPYEVTTTYTESELFEITFVQFGRILYLFHPSHAPAQLVWTSDTSWALSDVSFYPPATDEAGWSPATTITPGATTGSGITFTAGAASFLSGDVGRQIQNLVGAGKAVITAFTSTTQVTCTIVEDFPSTSAIASGDWKVDLSPIDTVTPSGSKIGSTINLTSSASNIWQASPAIGNYVLINNGVVKILSLTSAQIAVGEVQKSLNAVTGTANWSLERPAWSSSFGYPRAGTLFQQRLMLGGTDTNPITVWGSELGLLTSMGVGALDTDALSFDISGKDISKISWMAALGTNLIVGTPSGEFTVGSTADNVITPSFIPQQVRGYTGSNLQQPIGLDDQIIYIQKSGVKLNALRWDYQIDNYISENLLFLAEHLAKDANGIKEIAYANDPDKNIFAVCNDGTMLVCTYVREQQVKAWTKWTTNGSFESVETISTGENDEVWVVIKRTINGSTVRYVERLFRVADFDEYLNVFSDSCLTYSEPKTITSITKADPAVVTSAGHGFSDGDRVKIIGGDMTEVIGKTFLVANKTTDTFELTDVDGNDIDSTTYTTYVSGGEVHKLVTSVIGLDHLEGETVQVKVNGAAHADKTVTSGTVTLDSYGYEVTVGLSYTSTIETLPQEFTLGSGSQQGQRTRRVRPIVRVYKSAIPTIGGEFLPARAPTDKMDKALDLYTGDLVVGALDWQDGFSSTLEISTSKPYPLRVLGIFGSTDGGSQ